MHWEALSTQPPVWIRRAGRFLVVDLQAPHRVLSTSVRNGGQTEHLCLAASLAAKPHQWAEFRTRLHANGQFEPKSLVLAAIALGWSEKWRAS